MSRGNPMHLELGLQPLCPERTQKVRMMLSSMPMGVVRAMLKLL